MSIAGHVSRRMLEHYSRIRMDAKRSALEHVAYVQRGTVFEAGVHQNVNQLASGELNGGRDRDRTGDPLLAKQVLSQLSYTPPATI